MSFPHVASHRRPPSRTAASLPWHRQALPPAARAKSQGWSHTAVPVRTLQRGWFSTKLFKSKIFESGGRAVFLPESHARAQTSSRKPLYKRCSWTRDVPSLPFSDQKCVAGTWQHEPDSSCSFPGSFSDIQSDTSSHVACTMPQQQA